MLLYLTFFLVNSSEIGEIPRPEENIVDIENLSEDEIWGHIKGNADQLASSTDDRHDALGRIPIFGGNPDHPFIKTALLLRILRFQNTAFGKEMAAKFFPNKATVEEMLNSLPKSVFSDIKLFNGGANSIIFSAEANGQHLVLRVPGGVDAWAGSQLRGLGRATIFFPEIYGYFQCRVPGRTDAMTSIGVTCMEELEHTTLEELIGKITDSMVFEYVWGEWMGRRLKGMYFEDPDGLVCRNVGLRKVNKPRCYTTSGGKHYLLSGGLVPVQLDLDDAHEVPPGSCYLRSTPFSTDCLDPNAHAGKALVEHLNSRQVKETAEELLALYFSKFQISDISKAPEGTIFFDAK